MKSKSVHEPTAEVMSAAEVWEDAQQLADVLRQNLWKTEPLVKLPIPLSVFLFLLGRRVRPTHLSQVLPKCQG